MRSTDSDTFVALVEERSRHIESLRRETDAVRQDDTLSKQLAGMTVEVASERPTSTGYDTILSIDTDLAESFGELKMVMLRTTT